MKPRWRWFLFCFALEVFWRTGRGGRLMNWCVLPEWVGGPLERPASGTEPF